MNTDKPDSTTPTFSMMKIYYKKGIPIEDQQKQIIEVINNYIKNNGMQCKVAQVDIDATIEKNTTS
jgi:hypothetical protein